MVLLFQNWFKGSTFSEEFVNKVPTIAGSNKDEVKLWLATAEYFVQLDFSPVGEVLNIPKVSLKDEDAFEAFNYYRSSAWKIRGVDIPLQGLHKSGNKIYIHIDMTGMIIENMLLLISKSSSVQLTQQKFLY